jgi:hypothetical protein
MTQRIVATTLVDITESGVQRIRDNYTDAYHQQQNLNVLLQTIGMRTQLFEPKITMNHNVVLAHTPFDKMYGNQTATVWTLQFMVEAELIWSDGDDELAYLNQDVNGVAVTSDLDNTVDFAVNIFDTEDAVNIHFVVS